MFLRTVEVHLANQLVLIHFTQIIIIVTERNAVTVECILNLRGGVISEHWRHQCVGGLGDPPP